MKRVTVGSQVYMVPEQSHDVVRFLDKILVFYTDNEDGKLHWSLIPAQEIWRIDPERYRFYVDWNFDAYFHFLGKKIESRLIEILFSAINCTAMVSVRYHLNAWSAQREAIARAIRKRALKLMKRYYKGTFLTKRFRNILMHFINVISNKVSTTFREEFAIPQLPTVEYVC